jgi:hypothetical protein
MVGVEAKKAPAIGQAKQRLENELNTYIFPWMFLTVQQLQELNNFNGAVF